MVVCGRTVFFVLMAFATGACRTSHGPERARLLWADEFPGPRKAPPDSSKWGYDEGNGGPQNPGWGNHEKQVYTKSTENVFLDGEGDLVIRAIKTPEGHYTSGRITTKGRFSFRYGTLDARVRIPYAQGIWPAGWMLGDGFPSVAWPQCGEIDLFENFGRRSGDMSRNRSTVHGPNYPAEGMTGAFNLPDGKRISDDFHVFSLMWKPDNLTFFVDDQRFFTVTRASLHRGAQWVFDHPYFLLFNVAVGGSPAPVGYPDETTTFPYDMIIDYVRVYENVE